MTAMVMVCCLVALTLQTAHFAKANTAPSYTEAPHAIVSVANVNFDQAVTVPATGIGLNHYALSRGYDQIPIGAPNEKPAKIPQSLSGIASTSVGMPAIAHTGTLSAAMFKNETFAKIKNAARNLRTGSPTINTPADMQNLLQA